MKIELRILALGLVALFGSLLASSQGISAYQTVDRPSVSLAAGPSVLGTSGDAHASVIPAPASLVTSTLYLPVVMKPLPGIFGYLTDGSVPAPSISLELRLINGSSESTVANATTDSAGLYAFNGMPSLGSGQSYYVTWSNATDVTRLGIWASRPVTSYTAGSSVGLGTSDLANITLVAPVGGSTVALPRLFQWTPRPATLSDRYYFALFNTTTKAYWFSPLLGYVGSYTLTKLPSGFSPSVSYYWTVDLVDSNGAIGGAFWLSRVVFSNAGASVFGAPDMVPHSAAHPDDLPLRLLPAK